MPAPRKGERGAFGGAMDTQAKTKSLVELGLTARNASDVRVTGLAVDSRDVKVGHLFFGLPGT